MFKVVTIEDAGCGNCTVEAEFETRQEVETFIQSHDWTEAKKQGCTVEILDPSGESYAGDIAGCING